MTTVRNKPKEFVISRLLDAPRHEVWEAFTDPESMKKWWGPKGFTVRESRMDLRPGGTYLYCLRSPEGMDMWGKFIYREIVPQSRLVQVTSFSNENSEITRHPLNPDWPLEMLSTFTFIVQGDQTAFTVQWEPINASPAEIQAFEAGRVSMTQGWTGTLSQLAGYLETLPVVVEQIVDAPVKKVWDALTDKGQLKQWFFELKDFRAQRSFEFRFQAGTGQKKYLHICRVRDVIEERKLSYSWAYDGYEGESFVSIELYAEGGGKTRVRLTHDGLSTFPKINPDFAKKNFFEGWTSLIGSSLKNFVEAK